ncbi:protein lethal(2)essential for life-like [Pararge aegeria]|uniref:Jg14945 protein n=2 Tax=Pararge aegeria TaxID=116150 RepID=A0A8S4SI63_9NEOP|nr:protein lethal(2)essential for life-like [Pararge aegeria]CAH2266777.1 jg14945 [Pararge aegeria aegeria]
MFGRQFDGKKHRKSQNELRAFYQIVPKGYFDSIDSEFGRVADIIERVALKESHVSDYNKFQVNVDVQHFKPEEISVKVLDGYIIIECKHNEREDAHGFVSRHFLRKYPLPAGCLPDTVESSLSSDGVLTVTAPRILAMPSSGERIVVVVKTGPVRKKDGPFWM